MEVDEKEIGIEERIMARVIRIEKEKWRIVGVYVNRDLERKLGLLKDRI